MAVRPRISILGAGSVGCFIGGAWQAAGLDVSLVGRDAIGRDIAAHGITLLDQAGWKVSLPPEKIAFSTAPETLAEADIIALCVKSMATEAAAAEIAAHARPDAAVISFQNGVSNVEMLKEALPGRDLLAGVVPFNVAYLGQGRWLKGSAGNLTTEDRPVTRGLSARIGKGPPQLDLAADMTAIAWGKLLINLNNAVNALSGRTLRQQLIERDYRRVVAASMQEALALLDKAGIAPAKVAAVPPRLLPRVLAAPDILFRNLFLRLQKVDPQARSSMADDFAVGRQTEIDFLNGEVVKLAERTGREAPINAAIVKLVKQAEAGGKRDWRPEELRKAVLGR